MTLFEFILVMVSLVLAIGVTHLLQGMVDILRDPAAIRREWVRLLWATSLFPAAVVYWWSLWDFRLAEWTYASFFFVLLAPTSLFAAISLLFSTDTSTSTRHYVEFEELRRFFASVLVVYTLVWSADGWVLGVEPAWGEMRPPQGVIVLTLVIAAVSSARVARVCAVIWLVSALLTGFGPRIEPGAFGPP